MNLTILLIGELALALLVLCLLLLWHARRQSRAIAALEAEVVSQRRAAAARPIETPPPPAAPPPPAPAYDDLIDEQLSATRNYHVTLGAEHDIALDIAPEAPLPRQALALRNAMLIAEKEAWVAGDGKAVSWDLLIDKLSRIIEFYRDEQVAAVAPGGASDVSAMRDLLADFNRQSRDMLGALGTLEQELQELRLQLGETDVEAATVDVAAANDHYRRLESRYLVLEEQVAV